MQSFDEVFIAWFLVRVLGWRDCNDDAGRDERATLVGNVANEFVVVVKDDTAPTMSRNSAEKRDERSAAMVIYGDSTNQQQNK